MKQNRTFIFIMLLLTILGLTACSSNHDAVEGKYIYTYDKSIYYIFSKDNTYETNDKWDMPVDCSSGSYTIIDDKITLYGNKDEHYELKMGVIYNNYIGSWWNGTLSKSYENTSLTNTLGDLNLAYNLKKDKTFEYTVTSDGEIMHTENGTYSINNNEVVCTSENGQVSTFISIGNNTYCIEYIKE